MNTVEEIIKEKLKNVRSDVYDLVFDVEKGFESGQLSVGHLSFEDGRKVEIQIVVTSVEDDFIDRL